MKETSKSYRKKEDAAVTVKNISVTFRGFNGRKEQEIAALRDVSLNVRRGECLALVGGSGSGKSTLARVICGLTKPTQGQIEIDGRLMHGTAAKRRNRARDHSTQMVFQDPYSSLDPMWSVRKSIDEAFWLRFKSRSDLSGNDASYYLRMVGLSVSLGARQPKQLSGGQVQRGAIARALAAGPSILILDEAISSLDVSVQAQILQLVAKIKKEQQLTIIFIVHNLSVAAAISDRVAVLEQGSLVELGTAEAVFRNPEADYTRRLIDAIPSIARHQ